MVTPTIALVSSQMHRSNKLPLVSVDTGAFFANVAYEDYTHKVCQQGTGALVVLSSCDPRRCSMDVIKLRELALMISGRDMPTCRMHILIRRHFEAERVNPRTCHCCNAEDTATRLQSKHSAHHTLGVVIRVQSRDFLWLGISAPIIHGSRASGRSLSDYRS